MPLNEYLDNKNEENILKYTDFFKYVKKYGY